MIMKNKSGFTLIELLGVFTLLGVVSLVVVPYATGMLKKTKNDDQDRFNSNLFLATEAYIESGDRHNELQNDGDFIDVSLQELINSGFLGKNIVDPEQKKKVADLNYSIRITKSINGFEYQKV